MRWTWAAIGWTLWYVASKVHYAVDGRLGVSGGPAVPAARYADYAPGEVSQAQWANAAVGLGGVLLLALTVLPVGRRLPRRPLLLSLWSMVLMAAVGAIGMTGRDLLGGDGGAAFGGYCAVWAVLLAVATRDWQRRSRRPVAPFAGLPERRHPWSSGQRTDQLPARVAPRVREDQ